jgi:5-methylcytosine-specific restriction enzyme A
MPYAPLKPCAQPGCPALTATGRCPDHARLRHQRYDKNQRDQAAKKFYNSDLWHTTRAAKMQRCPLCETCKAAGLIIAADMVHHLDGDIYNLEFDNLQSLCLSCHSKTETKARGGFKPKPKSEGGEG